MTVKEQINQDLKTALLAGDKDKALTLRSLKSVILSAEIAEGAREEGLDDAKVISLLQKEAKKRQESADLYNQAGDSGRAEAELAEKQIIEAYLPQQLSDDEVAELVDVVIAENGAVTKETMGATIAAVKAKSGGAADGALIAKLVRDRL